MATIPPAFVWPPPQAQRISSASKLSGAEELYLEIGRLLNTDGGSVLQRLIADLSPFIRGEATIQGKELGFHRRDPFQEHGSESWQRSWPTHNMSPNCVGELSALVATLESLHHYGRGWEASSYLTAQTTSIDSLTQQFSAASIAPAHWQLDGTQPGSSKIQAPQIGHSTSSSPHDSVLGRPRSMSGVPQRYVPTSPRASRSGFPSSTHVLQPYSGARAAEESTLDPKFRRRSRKFFKTGRVLEALITQPADDEDGSVKSSESSFRVAHGERVFSKTRKYVIVLEYDRHCVVLPITTYNGQGVAKHGVVKAEHGIIYTGKTIPVVSDKEHPKIGEAPMQQHAIQVTPDDRTQLLQPRSRVVYSKPYVIEENQKVKSFGMLAESDIGPLQDQFREAMRLASGIPLAWTHDRSIPGLQLGEPQPRQDLQRQVL